tara:strand:+ start:2723 stop:2932 length:210 start_codon:yes stop_codon:yes gene_type:complete
MNILLSSVFRIDDLVRYFQEKLFERWQVFVTNSIAEMTGMFAAGVSVPAVNDQEFHNRLLDVCQRHQIS